MENGVTGMLLLQERVNCRHSSGGGCVNAMNMPHAEELLPYQSFVCQEYFFAACITTRQRNIG